MTARHLPVALLLMHLAACAASTPVSWPERPRLCYRGQILMADRPGESHYTSYTYKVIEEFFFYPQQNRMVEKQQVYSGEQVIWQKQKGLPLVFSMSETPAVFEYTASDAGLVLRGATASGEGWLEGGEAGWQRWRTVLHTELTGYSIESRYQRDGETLRIERRHFHEPWPCLSLPTRLPIALEVIEARQVGIHECQRVFDGGR